MYDLNLSVKQQDNVKFFYFTSTPVLSKSAQLNDGPIFPQKLNEFSLF